MDGDVGTVAVGLDRVLADDFLVDDGAPAESVVAMDPTATVSELAAAGALASARATRQAPRRPRAAALASVAMSVPDRVVTNATVAEVAGVTERWIVSRTGVHERRHVVDGEGVKDLALAAGRQALDDAGITGEQLDLLLVATTAADDLTPNSAPLVARALGARRAGAMDIGAACTGFLSALSLAAAQVEARRAEHVLVIGADVLSRLTDPTDRGTAALFSDGAGASVVRPAGGDGGRIGHIALHCDGSRGSLIRASRKERVIRMQGHDTYKAAVSCLADATLVAVERAGLELDDVDLFVYHQANARILGAVAKRLGIGCDLVIDCIDRYGNAGSATLPIALVDARERGMLEPGMNVLLAACGAGFTWGAGVIQWGA
jgi:3-oxoacyl-[acyl-carrier-protein] synthase III